MKKIPKTMFSKTIIENLRKIMLDRRITQEALAQFAGINASHMSKILNGTSRLDFDKLSKIASSLNLREIDIITYPEVYVSRSQKTNDENTEVVLQLKLRKDKQDQILKLVFGDNNIQILNK